MYIYRQRIQYISTLLSGFWQEVYAYIRPGVATDLTHIA